MIDIIYLLAYFGVISIVEDLVLNRKLRFNYFKFFQHGMYYWRWYQSIDIQPFDDYNRRNGRKY